MKKSILSCIVILGISVFSSVAMASRNDSNDMSSQNDINGEYYKKKMIDQCGHVSEVGMSSVFGEKSYHEKFYPELGTFSSELDRIKTIDGNTYASITGVFRQAKQDKDDLRLGLIQNQNMRNRNIVNLSVNQSGQSKVEQLYAQVQTELLQREAAVMQRAADSVMSIIQGDGRRSYGPNGNGGVPSTYDKWQQCQKWWVYEKKLSPWNN